MSTRRAAEKNLATLLTGHAIAEEAAVYPALMQVDEQHEASTAYMGRPPSRCFWPSSKRRTR